MSDPDPRRILMRSRENPDEARLRGLDPRRHPRDRPDSALPADVRVPELRGGSAVGVI
jgi:hypothetical protein